jgi:hypothetical protein
LSCAAGGVLPGAASAGAAAPASATASASAIALRPTGTSLIAPVPIRSQAAKRVFRFVPRRLNNVL